MASSPRFDTLCIHAGQHPNKEHGAVMQPIVLSSTFAQKKPGEYEKYDYSRAGNPTRTALEDCLAALEGAKHGLAFGSGCAATTMMSLTLKSGDHVLVGDDVYGGTFRIFDKVLPAFGVTASLVDMTDLGKLREAIRPETKMIWVETPSNPMLKIFDISGIAQIAKDRNLILAVDNTFATPALQTPLALGAALSVHSTTKYLNGHSDVVGGAIMTNDSALAERLAFLQKSVGAVPSPFDCYLTLRGVKTLGLRMKQHVASAKRIAEWLASHSQVENVYYPGLPTHPGFALAEKQMKGPGGMVSFVLKGSLEQASRFLSNVRVFTCAESLGGVESLAELPAIMTHASVPPENRAKLGIHDGLIRLSVGIENVDDLLEDLDRGFAAAK